MKHLILITVTLFLISSCEMEPVLNEDNLADYIQLNSSMELGDIVACAGGKESGLLGSQVQPTDVFFYPIQGANDFRYFEAENVSDSIDFSQYKAKTLESVPLFNGYMRKFNNSPFDGEKMGIVSYKSPEGFHISSPIRLKTNTKPTELNSGVIEVFENGIAPSFSWSDGLIDENIIYFHVISDANNNLISGTYTVEKAFTFYDLSNVVFNITDTSSTPSLEPNSLYNFTLMGISEDNWINLFAETTFNTE